MPKPPLLAVDTNFLIDLAADDATALDCLSTLRRKFPNVTIFVLPTVIDELAYLADEGNSDQKRTLALTAMQNLIEQWGLSPINCVPVGHGIVEETARKIRAAGLLPDEEVNDSLIIAEAALAGVAILISSDSHMKDMDASALKNILDGCDLAGTLIVSPWKIVNSFFNSVH